MKTSKRPWHEFKNIAGDVAEIWLYAEIGEDFWGDGSSIPARDFVKELNEITAPRIDLHIHSRGGSIGDGQAMFTALRNHPAQVTSYIDGFALSMATIVALAADKVVMARNGTFMIHEAHSGMCGLFTARDLKKQANALETLEETLTGIYAAKTGRAAEAIRADMEAESWYTAEQALEAGYIDEIGDELDLGSDAARDLSACGFHRVPDTLQPHPEPAAEADESADGDEQPTMNPTLIELLAKRRHDAPEEE